MGLAHYGAAIVLTLPLSLPVTSRFGREVANLEVVTATLHREAPATLNVPPQTPAALWYGTIMRRLPGDDMRDASNFISFAAEYEIGKPIRAWCDTNGNGDLTDDPRVRFSAYPTPDGARSFLVDLRWTAHAGKRQIPIESTIRVVLEPQPDSEAGATYRVQRVHAPMGEVALAGRPHRAILFDGNGDGIYTREFPDGFFLDLDDNLHFDIDPMSDEFAPMGASFVMEGGLYEVTSVDPEGLEMTVRRIRSAESTRQAAVGAAAPEFTYQDLEGRRISLSDYRGRIVLLYFWASWCGGCARQAPELAALYERYHPRGVEILGVSFDTEQSAMSAFRSSHAQRWPTSFSAHAFWEDPIGKIYRARRSGEVYLIDRAGRLDGTFSDLLRLSDRLDEMTPAVGAKAQPGH